MIFKPNDGRDSQIVSSTEEIKAYMGNVLKGYNRVEIHDNMVLAYLQEQGICIGTIE